MLTLHTPELLTGGIFMAGELAPPGVYRLIGANVKVHLITEDYLPAGEEGQLVSYERLYHTEEESLDGATDVSEERAPD